MNNICPKCGDKMLLNFQTSRVVCRKCGYVRPDEIADLEQVQRAARARPQPPAVQIEYRGEIKPFAAAAFESGQTAFWQGDRAEALGEFKRAADEQPDFVDAYVWIAKAADTPAEQREALNTALALMPNNLEATRMLMVLDGRLTPEQAAQTYHYNDQQIRPVLDTVNAKAAELKCPTCGGSLKVQGNQVICGFCGYTAARPQQDNGTGESLLMALLERKAQPTRWNVGQRLVKCQNCGAEQTLTAEKLSTRCRFCGSTKVLLNDALGSFEQPEAILRFTVSYEEAVESIKNQLNSFSERFMALFNTNKVKKGAVNGVYLPFWVFDTVLEVTRVKTIDMVETERSTYTEMVNGIAVCAVKSPPFELTKQLGRYDLSLTQDFDPKWLATYPAQIYSVDFDAASIESRALANEEMREKYGFQLGESTLSEAALFDQSDRNKTISVSVYSNVVNMGFRLVLLPVWIATLIEVDDDVRVAVVNGQSGKVALGKARRLEP